MNGTRIDHVALHVPADGLEEFVALYHDALGFEVEGLPAYRRGEHQYFCLRMADGSVLQIIPSRTFTRREVDGYDHIAIQTDEQLSELLERLEASTAEIKTVITERFGATGQSPSVYFEDPFGYTVELKPSNVTQ